MIQRFLLLITILALSISPALRAQNDEKPTIAILSFGYHSNVNLSVKGTLDMLQAYGYINQDERAVLDQQQDLEGEDINIYWGDAAYDIGFANLMVRDALDKDPDALITITTPVAQIAAKSTLDMDDPPLVIFNVVSNPYVAGIADAPCIKPAHISGSQFLAPYDRIVPLMLLQDPEMQVLGTIFTSNEPSGVFGANQITAVAESLGLQIERASIVSAADLTLAAEGLVSKGIEAFILPTEATVASGLPAIIQVANEHGLPVMYTAGNAVYRGATIGAGVYSYFKEGVIAARMLIAHLQGEIDIATAGINLQNDMSVGVNLDVAADQGLEISAEVLAAADFVVADGQSSEGVTPGLPEVNPYLEDMTLEERREADLAFLAALHCTDEMIAEQQAALDAADG
ncbi:MAG: ABC transporter substrate-binding protein [Chloroflexota bacterium]|nr:ABC transporter substrate-binding protein [Chloroflexota bacterium]MDE2947713.1 ABC transporter substrate-binding protein [Chloroflexota bacterium]